MQGDTIMNKIKSILFTSVPFLIAFGVQFFAVYYLLFIASVFLFQIAPGIKGDYYSFNDLLELSMDMNFNAMIMIIFSICCIIIFGIWYVKRCGGTFRVNMNREFHPLELLGLACLVPGTQYLCSLVAGIVSVLIPNSLDAYESLMESAGLAGDVPILMMIYSVLLAPISEELIFRGVTLRLAQRTLPFWIANILQALFFGFFHMNFLQGCYTFVVGLILGYVYHKGGTIYHAIFYHFLFNLWGTTASEWMQVEDPALQSLIMFVSIFFGLGIGFFLFHKGNQSKLHNHKI